MIVHITNGPLVGRNTVKKGLVRIETNTDIQLLSNSPCHIIIPNTQTNYVYKEGLTQVIFDSPMMQRLTRPFLSIFSHRHSYHTNPVVVVGYLTTHYSVFIRAIVIVNITAFSP